MNPRVLRQDFSNAKITLAAWAVLLASILLSYVAWKYHIHPTLNILWVIGIPVIAAIFSKSSVLDRLMAAVFFAFALLLGIGVTAALIGYP